MEVLLVARRFAAGQKLACGYSLELTLALHENLRHQSLWGMIGGRARCHLEYLVSSERERPSRIRHTWGCTAHVIVIECSAGTRKKGAGRMPGTKEWKCHSCTAFQGRHHFAGSRKVQVRREARLRKQGAACKITCTVQDLVVNIIACRKVQRARKYKTDWL